ncbi:response regulator transcription factor [bacterium]|nr:response regulator transcription factor [bacterium]
MPHIKGTDFLRSLSNPPQVIFTTAYRDYALEGFELDVIDYLLKPISFERFMKAMNKYLHVYNKTISNKATSSSQNNQHRQYLNVKSDRKTIRLPLNEIVYIEGMKDYVNIQTLEDSILCNTPLHKLEAKLPGNQFLQIHRSYIIAIDKIKAFTNEYIEIANRQLPIGRHFKKNVLEKIAQ